MWTLKINYMHMKILILRYSSIGDIVLTTPVIRVLKTQMKDTAIHFATKKEHASILTANPYVDKLHILEKSLIAHIEELRREKFDLVVDLHNSLRSNYVGLRLGVKTFRFRKLNWQKWLLVNFKVNKLPNIHIVDRYLETVHSLGVNMDQLGLDHFIPEKDEVEPEWLPRMHQNGYVAVVVGSKVPTKQLPVNRLIELCDKINRPIVLIGGKKESEIGQEVELFFESNPSNQPFEEGLKALGKKTRIFNGCGKFNLHQSASLIRQSTYVFTPDTGMMHIAAAFKKPIYSIWGSTVPEFGMYPYRTKFVIFENKKLPCRPCSKIGYNQCPKGHFKCMQENVFDFYLGE